MKSLFSVVIPIYGNEKNLPITVPYIIEHLELFENYRVEVIMVNDGSPDNSWEVMKKYQSEYPDLIKIASLSRNFGQMACIHAGMDLAKGDVIGVISADMQEPFELFADMLKEWEKGYKIVAGVRSGRDEKGIYATCASAFHNFIKKHLNPNYPEGGSDFFLMDRSVVSEYLKIDVQYTGGLLIRYWMGYEQKEIPYVRKKREVGKSGFGFLRKIGIAMELIVSNSIILLRKLLALAVIFVIAGGVLSIILAIRGQALGLILSFMLLMTGILLIGNCILG